LIKEIVDLFHPDEAQASHVTMLEEAVRAWKEFSLAWREYAAKHDEAVVRPILLVQVEDGVRTKVKNEETVSKTDLALVVSTLFKEIGPPAETGWIAHAFQEGTDLTLGAHTVRHIAPSKIDADPDVLAVLFKTSLNTGWDCPRAETMVSFRTAKDETNIAQLVGRMVRAPLARRIDSDESLNSVALYLPYYDHATVKKIVDRLTGDPSVMPPTDVREGADRVRLRPREGAEDIFALLAKLPTYTVPRRKKYKPVIRLAKLAGLLAETGLEADPVKFYRAALTKALIGEYEGLKDDAAFKASVTDAGVLGIARVRVQYGVNDAGGNDAPDSPYRSSARIADTDVDDIFAEAGRILGEGMQKEYARARKAAWDSAGGGGPFPMRTVKLEAWALASNASVIVKLEKRAIDLANRWARSHKAAFADLEEKYRQQLREIEGATDEPVEISLEIPDVVEWTKASKPWDRHIFVDENGKFHEDFVRSSWESAVITQELKNKSIVGWLRSVDRKPWAVCAPYKRGPDWVGTYPDFILFRRTEGRVIADIVDPHLLSDENAPARAGGLARYAEKHLVQYGRIDLVIVDGDTIRRLDLTDGPTRSKVLGVTTHSHLKQLFEGAAAT
jgi:type III restriction enzyme